MFSFVTSSYPRQCRLHTRRWFSGLRLSKESLTHLQASSYPFENKHVFVRADLNVPLSKSNANEITDDTRVKSILPTLRFLQDQKCKVVLCSHFGRPKGQKNASMSLRPVHQRLQELLGKSGSQIQMMPDCIGQEVTEARAALSPGEILLLENVRFYEEETANDPAFAQALAGNADLYVNDAFGTAHRAHASTVGITTYVPTNVAGFLMEKELTYLQGAVDEPKRPFTAVIGGAKVSTKIPVLKSLLSKCDHVLLGGGMIFTFYKAQGLSVGSSLVEPEQLELAREILDLAQQLKVELVLPTDVVVADTFDAQAQAKTVQVTDIPANWMGLDIGPNSIANFERILNQSQTIVWNGPSTYDLVS